MCFEKDPFLCVPTLSTWISIFCLAHFPINILIAPQNVCLHIFLTLERTNEKKWIKWIAVEIQKVIWWLETIFRRIPNVNCLNGIQEYRYIIMAGKGLLFEWYCEEKGVISVVSRTKRNGILEKKVFYWRLHLL